MFLTPCYNNITYVYKYACLVKLKYLEYLVNWTCTRPYFKSIPQPFAKAVRHDRSTLMTLSVQIFSPWNITRKLV